MRMPGTPLWIKMIHLLMSGVFSIATGDYTYIFWAYQMSLLVMALEYIAVVIECKR